MRYKHFCGFVLLVFTLTLLRISTLRMYPYHSISLHWHWTNRDHDRELKPNGRTTPKPSGHATQSCCEHHQYSRPALSIMPLRVLSTVGRGNHHGPHYLTSLNPTPDHHPPLFAQQFACSTSNALICSFHVRWLRTALSPTSNIL